MANIGEEVFSSCANCFKNFEGDGDRVMRISYFNDNQNHNKPDNHQDEDIKEAQGEDANGQQGESQQVEHLIHEHVDTSSSYHHDLGEGQETLELSVVTLEGVGVGVGGHHFQVDVEEAQHLIDSGVEVETVSILVNKKPFLDALNAQGMDSINPSEQHNPQVPHTLEDQEKHEYERVVVVEEGVTVVEALSVIFGIPLESGTTAAGDFAWRKDDPCALCQRCAQVVTILYSAFQEFNSLSVESSYVSKGIKQFLHRINSLNRMSLQQHEGHEFQAVGTSQPQQLVTPEKTYTTTHIKHPTTSRKKAATASSSGRRSSGIKRMKLVDEHEMISADIMSDVSSDSNSLSDLENEIIADANEVVRKTRTSTRPRIVKKQSSDYEELESSEEEPEEPYEDDEDDDPNFDAEEEIQGIKISQEQLALRRLSDICAGVLEYKEEDLQMDSEGKFICPDPECHKAFKGARTLNKHVVIHKLRKTPVCPKCSLEFDTLEELHRHMTSVHNPSKLRRQSRTPRQTKKRKIRRDLARGSSKAQTYTCLTCGEKFDNTSLLIQHEKVHGPVNCPTCSKEFSSPNLLMRHQKDVHVKKEIDFFCPECGEIFNNLESLTAHFVESHDQQLNFCTHCGKSFLRSRFLLQHLKETHLIPTENVKVERLSDDEDNGDETVMTEDSNNPLHEPGERQKKSDPTPFKCPHCDKEYKRKKQLDIHILFHNGEEPQHFCSFCSKRFFQLKSLKRHLLLHTTDNPHVCEHCDRVFPRADHLKRHIETSHSTDEKCLRNKKTRKESKDPVQYKCNDCDKTFTRKEYLRLHHRIHSGERPFMCSDCGKTFRDPRNLAQHLVTHKTDRPFCCSICGLTFKRAHHLNDHEGTHRDDVARPFVCVLPNCGKAFKLKKHLISHELVHSGTKDHQCEVCGKAFNRKDNLRQHVNKVHGKESFSDLIRVPAEVQIAPGQQVQIQVQTPTLVPVTAITDDGNNTTTITTIQLPSQVFQAIPATHFTYTHL